MKKIIFINGPPKSGKDTLGELIQRKHGVRDSVILKFATPLQEIAMVTLGVNRNTFDDLMTRKDTRLYEFGLSITLRELMIDISEKFIKPSLGEGWLAQKLVNSILRTKRRTNLFIITDTGFQNEFNTVCEALPVNTYNIILLNVRRHSCTFDGDSREHVISRYSTTIHNNHSIDHLAKHVKEHLHGI